MPTLLLQGTWLPVVLVLGTFAPAKADDDAWPEFRFLLGEWVADEKPGQGSGGFTLVPELQNKILVRRNVADIPAAQARPAGRHEDLMIVYREEGKTKASYYDNEGHIIRYNVASSSDGKGLVFMSEPQPTAPRFRLTYTSTDPKSIGIKFDIAPPGQPEQFRSYLEGSARRKPAVEESAKK